MKRYCILMIYLIITWSSWSQNAPITFIGSANPCQSTNLALSVIDTDFYNITAISLRLDYNPYILVYDTCININNHLSGLIANDCHVSDTLHKIMFVWSNATPQTIPDGQNLFDLLFFYNGGISQLTWNNFSNSGSDCEYTDADGEPLNDIPSSVYYKNGIVFGGPIGSAGPVIGLTELCQGDSGVVYSVTPILNAITYIWTIPQGAFITDGEGTNQITLFYSLVSAPGNIQVYGTAGNCAGPPSDLLWITVNPKPPTPVITELETSLVSDALIGNQWYNEQGIIPGANWQEYTPLESGSYYDIVTLYGCSSLPSNIINFVFVGLINYENHILKVFPNPVNEWLNISIQQSRNSNLSFEIYSAIGQLIFNCPVPLGQDKIKVPVKNLENGIYFVRITGYEHFYKWAYKIIKN